MRAWHRQCPASTAAARGPTFSSGNPRWPCFCCSACALARILRAAASRVNLFLAGASMRGRGGFELRFPWINNGCARNSASSLLACACRLHTAMFALNHNRLVNSWASSHLTSVITSLLNRYWQKLYNRVASRSLRRHWHFEARAGALF